MNWGTIKTKIMNNPKVKAMTKTKTHKQMEHGKHFYQASAASL